MTVPLVTAPSVADVLDALQDPVALLDATGRIVSVNEAWQALGLANGADPATTGVGSSYLAVCDAATGAGSEDAGRVAAGIRAVLQPGAAPPLVELVYPCPVPEGIRWFSVRVSAVPPPVGGVLVCHRDISAAWSAAADLERRASLDGLTSLANRSTFLRRLAAALADGPRPDAGVGVVFIDLDGFKPVNDTFGHAAGDDVLRSVARRLVEHSRTSDTVARLGGDEFALLLPDVTAAELDEVVARTTRVLAEPHRLELGPVVVRASAGAHLAGPDDHVATTMRRADEAMYVVKRAGARRGGGPSWPGRWSA